jgi:hypothetical protein
MLNFKIADIRMTQQKNFPEARRNIAYCNSSCYVEVQCVYYIFTINNACIKTCIFIKLCIVSVNLRIIVHYLTKYFLDNVIANILSICH